MDDLEKQTNMQKITCKRNYWEPGDCKENVELVFLKGKTYKCHYVPNNGYYLYKGSDQNPWSVLNCDQYFFDDSSFSGRYPFFKDYFYTIKELRKNKLLNINDISKEN